MKLQLMRVAHGMGLALILCTFLGCRTSPPAAGLSPDAKKIGSGKGFTFTAPTDGELFMVRNGNVEMMRWLAKGSKFEAVGPVPWSNPKEDFSAYEYYFKPTRMAQPDK